MKKFAKLFAMCAIVATSTVAAAQELYPVPEVPMMAKHGAFVESIAIPLFTKVKYEDRDDMAPGAVSKIIAVKNPFACKTACSCCDPECVYIEICVPACGCERVTYGRNGDRIRYDYGEYSVDVKVKKGYIEVEYED